MILCGWASEWSSATSSSSPSSTNQINICTLRVSEYNTDCEMRTTFCKCSGCSVVVVESSRVELWTDDGEEEEGAQRKGLVAVVVVRGFRINSDFINYFARVVFLALLPPSLLLPHSVSLVAALSLAAAPTKSKTRSLLLCHGERLDNLIHKRPESWFGLCG